MIPLDHIGITAGLKVTSDVRIFDFTGIKTVEYLLFWGIGYLGEEAY